MKPNIILTVAALITALSVVTGCATTRAGTQSCAVILIMDGQQLSPTKQQFEAVQRKLGAEFEQRSLTLVPDLSSAQLIATIECLPEPDTTTRTNLIVRHIGRNTFTPLPRPVSHPSITQSDREHAEAMRGFTRSSVD